MKQPRRVILRCLHVSALRVVTEARGCLTQPCRLSAELMPQRATWQGRLASASFRDGRKPIGCGSGKRCSDCGQRARQACSVPWMLTRIKWCLPSWRSLGAGGIMLQLRAHHCYGAGPCGDERLPGSCRKAGRDEAGHQQQGH